MPVSISSKTYTFTNGTANDAAPVDSEFTALFNNDGALETKVENLMLGNIEDSANITLNSAFTGSPSSNAGVFVERGVDTNTGVRWNETTNWWEVTHDGTNYYPISYVSSADISAPTDGMIWYNTTDDLFKGRLNGANVTFQTSATIPKRHISGPPVSYQSATTIRIPSGFKCADSTDAYLFSYGSNVDIAITTSGAAGLDTGSEASNTWYYVYAIGKTDGTVSGVISTVNEVVTGSITLPSGYTLKRQLPIAVRNDGSSNFIPFITYGDFVHLDVAKLYWGSPTVGTANVLNAGTAGTYTDVDASAFVPAISRRIRILTTSGNSTTYGQVRENGKSYEGATAIPTSATPANFFDVGVDSSRVFEYKRTSGAGSIYIDVDGFYVTEVY